MGFFSRSKGSKKTPSSTFSKPSNDKSGRSLSCPVQPSVEEELSSKTSKDKPARSLSHPVKPQVEEQSFNPASHYRYKTSNQKPVSLRTRHGHAVEWVPPRELFTPSTPPSLQRSFSGVSVVTNYATATIVAAKQPIQPRDGQNCGTSQSEPSDHTDLIRQALENGPFAAQVLEESEKGEITRERAKRLVNDMETIRMVVLQDPRYPRFDVLLDQEVFLYMVSHGEFEFTIGEAVWKRPVMRFGTLQYLFPDVWQEVVDLIRSWHQDYIPKLISAHTQATKELINLMEMHKLMNGLTRSKAKAKLSEALPVAIREAEEQLVQINKSIKGSGLGVSAMECVCKSFRGKKHGAGCICLHYDAQKKQLELPCLDKQVKAHCPGIKSGYSQEASGPSVECTLSNEEDHCYLLRDEEAS